MRKIFATVALLGVLVLSGCGMYGKPGDLTGIQKFEKFTESCTKAGGHIEEGPRDWYTCEMGGVR